jgi:hypothetical protein
MPPSLVPALHFSFSSLVFVVSIPRGQHIPYPVEAVLRALPYDLFALLPQRFDKIIFHVQLSTQRSA